MGAEHAPSQAGEPARDLSDVQTWASLVGEYLVRRSIMFRAGCSLELVSCTKSHGGALLFRASTSREGKAVAAKLFSEPARAAVEFHSAREVCGLSARTARSLAYDPALGLVVSEWVDGETLSSRLRGAHWEDTVAEAGQWLSRFHSEAPVPPPSRMDLGIVKCLSFLFLRPPFLAPSEQLDFDRAAIALARQWRGAMRGLQPVRLHGDFHEGNLILSSEGLTAIDMTMARQGLCFEDLARMTVRFDLLAEHGGQDFDATRARSAFLAGYGLHGSELEQQLALAEGLELLVRWFVVIRARKQGAARTVRALLHRRGWLPTGSA